MSGDELRFISTIVDGMIPRRDLVDLLKRMLALAADREIDMLALVTKDGKIHLSIVRTVKVDDGIHVTSRHDE
jgi:hypothetical protein